MSRRFIGVVLLLVASACARGPRIESLAPTPAPGGEAFTLLVRGGGFKTGAVVSIDGERVSTKRVDDTALEVAVAPQTRGLRSIRVHVGERDSEEAPLTIENSAVTIEVPAAHLLLAGASIALPISVRDFDHDDIRLTTQSTAGHARIEDETLRISTQTTGPERFEIVVVATDGIDAVRTTVAIETVTELPAPRIIRSSVSELPGSVPTAVQLMGEDFTPSTKVFFEGRILPTVVRSRRRLTVRFPARTRGTYSVHAENDGAASGPFEIEVGNSAPVVSAVSVTIDEGEPVEIPVEATDPEGDPITKYAIDLWPGARFDAATDRVRFVPDFIQGGRTYRGTLVARDATDTATAAVVVKVRDSIRPPSPTMVSSTAKSDHERVVLEQTTDAWLDPSGRTFEARLVVPKNPKRRLPLRVYLHGFGGTPFVGGRGDVFGVYPHDPDNSYWWGSMNAKGELTPYTARRVLHLVRWILDNYPGVDPERVYLFGASMGGAGATTIGTVYARHFAFAEGTMGQMIPRRHRPLRLAQLGALWGPPSKAWDEIDVVRLLAESEEAQNQFLITKHGKDDPVIHFGAVLLASPVVHLNYFDVLQREKIGSYAAWDEGAHGPPDPVLGSKWWKDSWEPARDPTTRLIRNRAFVAFTNSSLDDDPGRAEGDGTRAFDADRGFGGNLSVVDDQGWGGDRAGAINRYLRWDTASIEDELDRFSVRLFSLKPARVEVTPRRTQRFLLRPGETVTWRMGNANGVVTADQHGLVSATVDLRRKRSTLIFERRR